MKHYYKSIFILILGLSFFHVFSTLQVYLSNTGLLAISEGVRNNGYLLMPNALIMEKLGDFSTAFAGGVFFTLSVGTLTVLVSFISAVFFFRNGGAKKITSGMFLIFFLLFLILLNINGFCFVETLSFICVPGGTFFLYNFFFKGNQDKPNLITLGLHVMPVVILAGFLLLSSSGASGKIFSDFRDNLLMSNRAGMAINEFYYDNTLYPARVFKPFSQRIPKSCSVQSQAVSGDVKRIEHRLLTHDYLVVGEKDNPEFFVIVDGENLRFVYQGETISTATVKSFIARPGTLLKEFSQKTDKYGFYRQVTALSLKTGFPLFMYILMHGVFFTGFHLVLFKKKELIPILASAGCLAVGGLTFLFLFLAESYDVSAGRLPEVLSSKDVKERIAGLRFVTERNLDLKKFVDYDTGFTDNYIPEKYWFTRSLAYSQGKGSYETLIGLLKDPNQNVVCQALYSLGMQRKKRAVPVIIQHISDSEDWYVQWYAYRALKRLRWKQKK